MPPDLAEQIPWVHEACEALGVPILTSQTFEADDVIGTLAMKAHAAGLRGRDRHRRQGLLPAGHGRHPVYNPRDDGTWFDADGVKEKFGVLPEQVVDVLALMGDSIDNIKGVPGIGEKGARDLIAKYGSLEELLAHAGEGHQQAVPRRAAGPRRRRASEPRAGADPHRRAGDVRSGGRCSIAARRARSASSCSRRLGFRSLVMEFAPTAETVGKDYSVVDTPEALRRARRRAARGRAIRAFASCRTARRRCVPGSPAWRSRPRRARRAYVPDRRAHASGGGLFGDAGDDRTARPATRDACWRPSKPLLEDAAHPQGRARPEVRRDRARAPRRSRCAASSSTR